MASDLEERKKLVMWQIGVLEAYKMVPRSNMVEVVNYARADLVAMSHEEILCICRGHILQLVAKSVSYLNVNEMATALVGHYIPGSGFIMFGGCRYKFIGSNVIQFDPIDKNNGGHRSVYQIVRRVVR